MFKKQEKKRKEKKAEIENMKMSSEIDEKNQHFFKIHQKKTINMRNRILERRMKKKTKNGTFFFKKNEKPFFKTEKKKKWKINVKRVQQKRKKKTKPSFGSKKENRKRKFRTDLQGYNFL